VLKGLLQKKVFKKKLHLLKPGKKVYTIEAHHTKREIKKRSETTVSIERGVREFLSRKVSGTLLGLWLLMPEHLRLGTWDLLKKWSGKRDDDIAPRLGLQLVHEAALCVGGIRRNRSLCHQGFELANGLPFIATDTEIHSLLNTCTIAQSIALQRDLGMRRQKRGHYTSDVLALDPHRITSYSRRIMPKKKKNPQDSQKKVVQTFFCIDAFTGQPLGCTIGSSGKSVTKATIELMEIVKSVYPSRCIIMADIEHYTSVLVDYFHDEKLFDILLPAHNNKKIEQIGEQLTYKSQWPGYALAETTYQLSNSHYPVRLIIQRSGENKNDYIYKAFITTGNGSALSLLSEQYTERWTIEEFFNFEAPIGWNKISTLNLNIAYGKLSVSLIAQAALYQLRKKLPAPYKNWTAEHLANSVFHGIDGDIKVKDDTIIVTMYNVPNALMLDKHYENLPKILENEGVNPKIPWLYDFKLDFRFK
jgi:hypothetical protein